MVDIYGIGNSILSIQMIGLMVVIILDDYYCFESMMRIIDAADAAIDYLNSMGR